MIILNQIVAVADVPNKNGRIYPRAVLEKLVGVLKEAEGFGTLGNIEFPQTVIDLSQVAFKWFNLRLEGDNLVADIRVLSTPYGQILMDCNLDHFAFRTMGIATISADGVVGDDYKLIGLSALAIDQAA